MTRQDDTAFDLRADIGVKIGLGAIIIIDALTVGKETSLSINARASIGVCPLWEVRR